MKADLIDRLLYGLAVLSLLVAAIVAVVRMQSAGYRPSGWLPSGADTAAVLVLSADCTACQDQRLIDAIRYALSAEARARRQGFHYIGVAVDWDVARGLDMLERLGPFTEVTAGNAWANLSVLATSGLDVVSVPATPQLILLERDLAVGDDQTIKAISQRIADRRLGVGSIVEWFERRYGEIARSGR